MQLKKIPALSRHFILLFTCSENTILKYKLQNHKSSYNHDTAGYKHYSNTVFHIYENVLNSLLFHKNL